MVSLVRFEPEYPYICDQSSKKVLGENINSLLWYQQFNESTYFDPSCVHIENDSDVAKSFTDYFVNINNT